MMGNSIYKSIQKNERRELGLYIHVPFCVRKCDYCDFLSAPADKNTMDRYFDALLEEIRSYSGKTNNYRVTTVFIGGGTPSSVEASYINNVLDTIRDVFRVEPEVEITIELNPGTVDKDKLMIYKAAGINRLSIGLQSTNDHELKLLGRIHTYGEFLNNYSMARELGFANINIDLMSALPGQTLKDWETTLYRVAELGPEHISAYSLIIEEDTPFFNRYGNEQSKELPDEETDRLIYQRTKEILEEFGYHRYEISNYAKEGYECLHNLCYWTGKEYLGLGLGASSLIDNTRFHNLENISEYIMLCTKACKMDTGAQLEHSEHGLSERLQDVLDIRRDTEQLSSVQQMEEFMFLGLRLTKGISRETFFDRFGMSYDSQYKSVTERLISQHLLIEEGDRIRLTEYGTDISNMVLAEFLLE